MSFLHDILTSLDKAGDTPVMEELRDGNTISVTGRELLEMIHHARAFLAAKNISKGERCALLAHNSIRWVAMDLAIMSEGLIVVPLYARQAPSELVGMMKDCSPALMCCGGATLRDGIVQSWAEAPSQYLFEEVFGGDRSKDAAARAETPVPHHNSEAVTIIYTSGTSGDAKGVTLNAENIGYMLSCTSAQLDSLMQSTTRQDRVFHYLPFSFGASRIALFTYLLRGSLVVLNTDLTKLATEIPSVAADYFLNVPALLERMRKAVETQLTEKGGIARHLYNRGKAAWSRKQAGKPRVYDWLWLACANAIVFPAIRKKMVGRNLKALISGSAPLAVETQFYFRMLGIPVLQVYGLTETTGICTMDDPSEVVPGRVGPAISGIEMKLAEHDEIIVRGPNIFPGYWNRPLETAKVLRDGWFHTGDQGEVDARGNWRVIGRIKNLIILSSGHKFPPEPLEEELLQNIPGAQHVVLVGNGRGYLSAIVTGNVSREGVQSAMDSTNLNLPHYKQIRAFHISIEPLSIENSLLTANGKLKRDLIAERFKGPIEEMYLAKQAS